MKTRWIYLVVTVIGLIGCSSKENNPSNNQGANAVTTTTAPGSSTTTTTSPAGGGRQDHNLQEFWSSGATAALNVIDYPTLEKYTGRPMGDVSDIQLNVSLSNEGASTSPSYGGNVKIGYHEKNGLGTTVFSYGDFTSNTGAKSAVEDNQYNKWVSPTQFHGFFEDDFGALMLVVDGTDDGNLLSGRVYFKNWNTNVCNTQPPYYCAPKPPTACWFISLGPYNCQDFVVNGSINTYAYLYPSSYTLLGYFVGLSKSVAFGN